MGRIIDITGKKYNKLTVLGLAYLKNINGKSRSYWQCKCDCGNEVILRKDEFIYPYSKTKSCGCWHIEESSKRPHSKENGYFISLKKGEVYE